MVRRLSILRTVLALALSALFAPSARADTAPAVLIVADDGGLEQQSVRALRGLAASGLRKRSIQLSDEARFDGVHPTDAATQVLLRDSGASRVFALRINGRLGQKVPLTLEELAPGSLATLDTASLTASTIEECDSVMPRLVDAIIDRKSAEDNAHLTTVTKQESKPFNKRPGERFWVIGLPIALYKGGGGGSLSGFSLAFLYETEFFRMGVTGQVASNEGLSAGALTLDAAWLPFASEFSPYLGGGLGYMGAGDNAGMGAKLEVGFEVFRLHSVRLSAGLDVLIPLFESHYYSYATGGYPSSSGRLAYPMAHLRFGF